MIQENRRRRRISLQPKGTPAIIDELEFISNKCSLNARRIGEKIETTTVVDFWIDKHYHIRYQHGDEKGKREGIEPEKVQNIVTESLKHLIFYAGSVKNFTFLNHNIKTGNRNLRVVCQKVFDGNKTNVTIEAHIISLNEFEITIVTAIQNNDYLPSDGQYTIELLGGENSCLYYSSRGKISEISNI